MDLRGVVRHIEAGLVDFYIILGEDESGALQHTSIQGARTNGDIRHLLVGVSELINLCLLYKVPVLKIADRLRFIRGETAGVTKDRNIALSILDYIGRMLEERYKEKQSA